MIYHIPRKKFALESSISLLQNNEFNLEMANSIIGWSIIYLGEIKNDQKLIEDGTWIRNNAHLPQYSIDDKVIDIFSNFRKHKKINEILQSLKQKPPQSFADKQIAHILETISNL